MVLRKICNHPFLVAEPVTKAGTPIGEANPKILIEACGKLKLLDRMMRRLHAQVGREGRMEGREGGKKGPERSGVQASCDVEVEGRFQKRGKVYGGK
jgi:hypothetical protein